jgi:uncharacterized protein (DUF1697 family)
VKPVAVLLRAVNAGRPLVMADLRKALARLGYPDAMTVLASGNAVIRAKAAPRVAAVAIGRVAAAAAAG